MNEHQNPVGVRCITPSVVPGEEVLIDVESGWGEHYETVQVDVIRCGVLNPTLAWMAGSATHLSPGPYRFTVDSSAMSTGFYEVGCVGFHSAESSEEVQPKYFYGSRDFERTFFEVRQAGEAAHTEEEVRSLVAESERNIEDEFQSGLDISSGSSESQTYLVLVFVAGVLVTERMRFHRWEIVPFRGLDKKDQVEVVNEFLNAHSIEVRFEHTQQQSESVRRERPTYVAHFPLIKAASEQQLLDYVTKEVDTLSEVLALYRGGNGQIFNIFMGHLEADMVELHGPRSTYRGNLVTGQPAGEDPEHIAASLGKMRSASFRYLFSLYREALSEQNLDFRYVRCWQILEVLAEAQNYDLKEKIYDAYGTPILTDGEKQIRLGGNGKANAKAIVYRLLYDLHRERGIHMSLKIPLPPIAGGGERFITYSLWERVRAWHGIRNAAVHFGGFQPSDPLQQERFIDFNICKRVYKDMQVIGQDVLIGSLQGAVRLALPLT